MERKVDSLIESPDFKFGFGPDGKRWIQGHVSVGKGRVVYVDTQKGTGVNKILEHLHKFVTYQATKVKFPSYSEEDIIQEIRVLALEAIPKYDNTRKSNMLTFLQNHVKNRIINLCKFVSEKRRRATYYSENQCKVRCPDCKKFTKIYQATSVFTCQSCFKKAPSNDPGWKKYNLPVVPILFGTIEEKHKNSRGSDVDSSGEIMQLVLANDNPDLVFSGNLTMGLDDKIQKRLDFLRIYEKLDEVNKSIIRMVIEGYTYKDIAVEVGISEKAAYARASKIIKAGSNAKRI